MNHDVIVVGLGAMGSATVDELAGRGLRVLGIDSFAQGHTYGSSHGATRIVRHVIEEAPFYVPIVLDAVERWADLEADSATELLVRCGVLRLAPPTSDLHRSFRASAAEWSLPFDELTGSQVEERFPAFAVPDGYTGLFEADGGVIHADRAVRALQKRARRFGADLRFGEPVNGWAADTNSVTVTTGDATYSADRLVITAGAWTGRLAADLELPLVVNRVVNVSFEPSPRPLFEPGRLPAFLIADDHGTAGADGGMPSLRGDGLYGVPAVKGEGLKVGTSGTPTDPDDVDREVSDAEIERLRDWAIRFLPGAVGAVASTLTCLYTKTPDEHFVLGVHPEHDNVVVASPCSGHGFKYTPAMGAILADLALGAQPRHDITPFALTRFRP